MSKKESLLTRVILARHKLKTAQEELEECQLDCTHPKETITVENHASEGYAERTIYSKHMNCGICGKFWSEDQ
jgi:hypothetical protein